MGQVICPSCGAGVPPQEVAGGWCEACGKKIPPYSFGGTASPPRSSASWRPTEEPVDRSAQSRQPSPPIIDRIGRMLGAHASEETPSPWGVGKRILYGLLGLFLTTIFGALFAWLVYSLVECQASRSWPSVRGKVLSAGVTEKVGRTSRGHRTVEYSASVVYQYTVGGQEYTSSQLGFGSNQNYSFLARALAGRYHENQQVTVYHDPANPKNAVLLREVLFGSYVGGLVGLFASFIGLRLLLLSLTPTLASSNSRWLPWSRRFTWLDLPLTALGALGAVLWIPMLFGL